ncbi:MAG: tetratricopeptide repeat protein [Ignavibacteria bacterium]|jgi:tetratricopeptide (TPR) repeat protein|nr:tetratricopeptide repeat protein [Ignavibacteria bacterium]
MKSFKIFVAIVAIAIIGATTLYAEDFKERVISVHTDISARPIDSMIAKKLSGILLEMIYFCDSAFTIDSMLALEMIYFCNETKYEIFDKLLGQGGAAAALDVVIAALPEDFRLWYLQEKILFKSRRYNRAMMCSDKLVELIPNNIITWFSRGIIYSRLGRKDEAIECLHKALELATDENIKSIIQENLDLTMEEQKNN